MENLLNKIKFITGKTTEGVAKEIGYSRVYLTKEVKTGDNDEIMKRLQEYEKSLSEDGVHKKRKEDESEIMRMLRDIHSNLRETRHTVELNQALAKANLFQVAKLESLATRDPHRNILEGLNKVTAKIFEEMHLGSDQTSAG